MRFDITPVQLSLSLAALAVSGATLLSCVSSPGTPLKKPSLPVIAGRPLRAGVQLTGRLWVPDTLKVSADVGLVSNNGGGLVSNNGGGLISAGGGIIGNNGYGITNRNVGSNGLDAMSRNLRLSSIEPASLALVKGARLYLSDAAGNAIPGLETVHTDARGTFQFLSVPSGYTFMVKAEVMTLDGKVAVFRSLVKVSDLGASVDLNPASTMITVNVVEGLSRGELGEFNPGKFQAASEAVSRKLTASNLPDFTDTASIKSSIATLSAQIAELRDLLNEIQADLREIKQSLSELAERTSNSPQPVASLSTPSPLPLLPVATAPSSNATLAGSVVTLAGSVRGMSDGTGTSARFYNPRSLAVDRFGQVLVVDTLNNGIRKVSPEGEVTTLVGPSIMTGVSSQLNVPKSIAIAENGLIYIADTNNHVIRVLKDGTLRTFAGSNAGFSDGTGENAMFNFPSGLAVSSSGLLYLTDTQNHCIRTVDEEGRVKTLAGSNSGNVNGNAAAALFNRPTGVTVDKNGNVYIADTGNHLIRKLDAQGVVTTLAGSQKGYRDGAGPTAAFNEPTGVAVDAAGDVYVADSGNHVIRKISANGQVETYAGVTRSGTAQGNQDGKLNIAQFNYPSGIAIDREGIVYVADTMNSRIRKVIPLRRLSYRTRTLPAN